MADKKATRVAYGEYLVELGKKNDKILVLDADLANATKTDGFKAAFPERFFDCGIAEANMVDTAAGLSAMGFIPFVSTFAVFGTGRAYEQIRNSIAYPQFNVKLAFTHAGVSVGEDGGSHQSIEDIALMRVIPGMTILVPSDANETKKALDAAIEINGPVFIRLSRPASEVLPEMPFEVGKANVLKDGSDVALITCGLTVSQCLKAAQKLEDKGVSVAVINMHTIKPLDEETILKYAEKCSKIVTVEEHSVIGGLGDAVASVLCGKTGFTFKKIGINDQFGQSGTSDELMAEYGLSGDKIAEAVEQF